MAERKIKGLFLGVPVLSQGSYTEDDRLRRDGLGYAFLAFMTYMSSDYIVSLTLMSLCLSVTLYLNISKKPIYEIRVSIHAIFSVRYSIYAASSGTAGFDYIFILSSLVYYGLMYYTHFDR